MSASTETRPSDCLYRVQTPKLRILSPEEKVAKNTRTKIVRPLVSINCKNCGVSFQVAENVQNKTKFCNPKCTSKYHDSRRIGTRNKFYGQVCSFCPKRTNSINGACRECQSYVKKANDVAIQIEEGGVIVEENEISYKACDTCEYGIPSEDSFLKFECLAQCAGTCKPWGKIVGTQWVSRD